MTLGCWEVHLRHETRFKRLLKCSTEAVSPCSSSQSPSTYPLETPRTLRHPTLTTHTSAHQNTLLRYACDLLHPRPPQTHRSMCKHEHVFIAYELTSLDYSISEPLPRGARSPRPRRRLPSPPCTGLRTAAEAGRPYTPYTVVSRRL